MKNKKKIMILASIIIGVLVVTLGITYAMFTFSETGATSKLILGDIYMRYRETDTIIDIDDMMPTSTVPNEYFEFTITGKNTHLTSNIFYNIQISEGDQPEAKEGETLVKILDKFLRFRLTLVNGETETILVDNASYQTIDNTTIYSALIPSQTNNEITDTYRLYMWISDEVILGNTEGTDYTLEEWSKLYASIRVNVNGEYSVPKPLTTTIKSRLGLDGLVAVNTEGTLYDSTDETQTIREYRYSGIGNYCTYTIDTEDISMSIEENTCPEQAYYNHTPSIFGTPAGSLVYSSTTDANIISPPSNGLINLKTAGSTPTDSGLRNYIEFNGELWRIIGVFGDSVKIVRNTPLENDIYTDTTYQTEDMTYTLKYTTEGTKYGYFYYNNPVDTYTGDLRDWSQSGLMHYLNDESGNSYYNSVLSSSAKAMIQETTYYLGILTVSSNSGQLGGTASSLYAGERQTGLGSWTGNIGLMYPSDYVYASNTENWSKSAEQAYMNGISSSNWMFNTDAYSARFISPAQYESNIIVEHSYDGMMGANSAAFYSSVRPTLYLKSDVMVSSGDGSYNNPYKIYL